MLSDFGLVPTNSKAVKADQRFGRLFVLQTGQIEGTYRYMAVCRCDCGSSLVRVRFDALTSGATVSCGCVHLEAITTHGLTGTVHIDRWRHMMSRCHDERDEAYPDYGGRGISVCAEWHDPAVFSDGLPAGYWPGAHMDRINNDGNYEPGNVRWATPKQNNGNRRSTTAMTFRGQTKTQREWAEELGLDERRIHARIHRHGWSIEQALSAPATSLEETVARAAATRWAGHDTKGRPPPKTERRLLRVEYQGRQLTMAELSGLCGVSAKDLRRRIIELRWPIERAVAP